jgi:hypothetical protein
MCTLGSGSSLQNSQMVLPKWGGSKNFNFVFTFGVIVVVVIVIVIVIGEVRQGKFVFVVLWHRHSQSNTDRSGRFVVVSSPFVKDRQLTVPVVLFTALAVTLTALRKHVTFFFRAGSLTVAQVRFASPMMLRKVIRLESLPFDLACSDNNSSIINKSSGGD